MITFAEPLTATPVIAALGSVHVAPEGAQRGAADGDAGYRGGGRVGDVEVGYIGEVDAIGVDLEFDGERVGTPVVADACGARRGAQNRLGALGERAELGMSSPESWIEIGIPTGLPVLSSRTSTRAPATAVATRAWRYGTK